MEPIAEDDQLSNILSQDSKVFDIDKTIDDIKKSETAVPEDAKSDTHSKT